MNGVPRFDNSDQLKRVLYRLRSYRKIGFHALNRGVRFSSMLLTKFPFLFKDRDKPSLLGVEFTDACNLACTYCNNPLLPKPRGFMSDETFSSLVREQKKERLERIKVGGGEPTLHSRFGDFSKKLKEQTPYLEIVTNAHWRDPEVADHLVDHYDLIEISLDAGDKEDYESVRKGGVHEKVKDNIILLSQKLKEKKNRGLLVIRLMIRPSTAHCKDRDMRFWNRYCDAVMPQYVLKHPDVPHSDDVYMPEQVDEDKVPQCTIPFKNLQVKPNGDIPMCPVTGNALNPSKKLILGNIQKEGIRGTWKGPVMEKVREGHRKRRTENLSICRGCSGR